MAYTHPKLWWSWCPCLPKAISTSSYPLSRLVSAYDIQVHYIAAATNIRQAKLRVHGWNPNSSPKIYFHDISVPPFPCPPPDPTDPIKFPSQILSSIYATPPSPLSSVVQDVASIQNAEAYPFHSISAFATFLYSWEGMEMQLEEEAKRYIPDDVPSLKGCSTSDFWDFVVEQCKFKSIIS
ncbi:hypothetical protein TIFTF001_024498 [Ficus carica]|uniref:Glycosyltransferase N-terminal domain-containing protein n=1 Tax=Ficus carica TaxID=3494 RepID=A0AA88DG38_FICCA|nr:hypothetical protein TIFTF001_024498 [Ficus carica]